MPAFRPAVINQILTELDNTIFSKHLFQFKIDEEDFLLQIILNPNPSYSFTLKQLTPAQPNQNFLTLEAPGDVEVDVQEYRFDTLAQARSRISQWINRIQEDYRLSAPEYLDLDQLREEMLSQFEQTESSTDQYFSDSEKTQLEEKLTQMEERIENLYREKDASQQQINIMKQQLNRLKQSVEVLDKRTWLSAAVNRVFDIYKEVKAATNEVSSLMHDFNNLLPAPEENSSNKDGEE